MKTFKFPLVLRTRENTDVFISLDDNIYGIHSKSKYPLYIEIIDAQRRTSTEEPLWNGLRGSKLYRHVFVKKLMKHHSETPW